ncbi:hypothetical protein CTI12_AA059250 [Artemisia annua]|uniref:Uncharacterized protein n=1 Tax=Artemisia annua TaxID=35608 RepID=A0A2U1PX12_ARTAN|nr:hypothetical protein CTI12_AA059250 [Artemisia annua]
MPIKRTSDQYVQPVKATSEEIFQQNKPPPRRDCRPTGCSLSNLMLKNEQGVSKATRNKSLVNTSDNNLGPPSASERTTSLYFCPTASSNGSSHSRSYSSFGRYSDQENVSAKPVESWPRKVVADSSSVNKSSLNNGSTLRSGGGAISSLSVETQRLEELAVKPSRQLIPMTPFMPKALLAINKSNPICFQEDQLGEEIDESLAVVNAIGSGSEGADSSLQKQYNKDLTVKASETIALSILNALLAITKHLSLLQVTPNNMDIAKVVPTYHLYTPAEVEVVIDHL